MAVAGNVSQFTRTINSSVRTVALTFSGNYTTGGDTLDLTKLTNTGFIPGALQFGRLPVRITINNLPDGYTAEWIPGTTLANGKIKWNTASNTELGAGAYPAGISGATDVTMTFEFKGIF